MLENSRLLQDSWLRWSAKNKENAQVCIMGIPFDNAVSNKKGAAEAPETLRRLSVELSDVTEDFVPMKEDVLYDIGDIPAELDWKQYFETLQNESYQLMKTGKFCLFLGGDHSVSIPLHKSFGKYQKEQKPNAKIGIIHFDAHYDLCEEYDGHPWSHACTEARALEDVISGEDLFFVGVRVAELQELKVIEQHPGIVTVGAAEVARQGVEAAFAKMKEHFKNYDALYFTLDIDVLDPAFAPGTGTPVAGGLASRQLIELVKLMLNELPIKAMDIVEVAPPLDVNDITSWAALRIIHEVLTHFSDCKNLGIS